MLYHQMKFWPNYLRRGKGAWLSSDFYDASFLRELGGSGAGERTCVKSELIWASYMQLSTMLLLWLYVLGACINLIIFALMCIFYVKLVHFIKNYKEV